MAKKKIDKTKLAARILCLILAGLMVIGAVVSILVYFI